MDVKSKLLRGAISISWREKKASKVNTRTQAIRVHKIYDYLSSKHGSMDEREEGWRWISWQFLRTLRSSAIEYNSREREVEVLSFDIQSHAMLLSILFSLLSRNSLSLDSVWLVLCACSRMHNCEERLKLHSHIPRWSIETRSMLTEEDDTDRPAVYGNFFRDLLVTPSLALASMLLFHFHVDVQPERRAWKAI